MAEKRPPVQGYIDPNWPNPNGDGDAPIIIYGYTPSAALAILGAVLFALSTVAHVAQLIIHRPCWYFTTVCIGAAFEVVGYIFRSFSAKINPYFVRYFVIQYFFIVTAPVLFSAAIYAVLSVLINRVGRQYAPLGPRTIITIFVICDVIATVVQVAGAALIGKTQSNRESSTTANNILLAGLAFQVFAFAVFLILLAVFLVKARKAMRLFVPPAFLFSFVTASILIYLRILFRLAETAEGLYGFLMTHEVFFGCLEFVPVIVAVFLFNVWHPGRCLPLKSAVTSSGYSP